MDAYFDTSQSSHLIVVVFSLLLLKTLIKNKLNFITIGIIFSSKQETIYTLTGPYENVLEFCPKENPIFV